MDKTEFQTEQVVNEFERLFKQSFKDGCQPRQKADLLAFFMAGYIAYNQDFKSALKNMGFEGGILFMDEIVQDTFDRSRHLINCVVKNDLSHKMFN